MTPLTITAISKSIDVDMLRGINDSMEHLLKIVKFELMDTGIFRETYYKSVELTLDIDTYAETTLSLQEDKGSKVLKAVAQISKDELEITIEEQAVLVLQKLAEYFNLDAQVLKARAFHLQSERLKSSRDTTSSYVEDDIDRSVPYVSNIPELIPVNHDEEDFGYARFIGTFGDGKQFWGRVAAQFEMPSENDDSAWEKRKRWYGILHTFDANGKHLDTKCKFTGTTADGEVEACDRGLKFMQSELKKLEPLKYGDIKIALFKVEIDGFIFGLVDSSDHDWGDTATMEPGDLVFYPPWDGNYDT